MITTNIPQKTSLKPSFTDQASAQLASRKITQEGLLHLYSNIELNFYHQRFSFS